MEGKMEFNSKEEAIMFIQGLVDSFNISEKEIF